MHWKNNEKDLKQLKAFLTMFPHRSSLRVFWKRMSFIMIPLPRKLANSHFCVRANKHPDKNHFVIIEYLSFSFFSYYYCVDWKETKRPINFPILNTLVNWSIDISYLEVTLPIFNPTGAKVLKISRSELRFMPAG